MSDIDTYLTQLRSHLRDLDPKRADEIIAEARTHLESRAAQLRAGGMESGEATAEALCTFGDAVRVAHDLLESNAAHRRPVALRAVAAFVIAFGSIFVLGALLPHAAALIVGVITLPRGLDPEYATRIVNWVAYCCIALLTGIVGGRRFWWIAALLGFVMIGFSLFALYVVPPTVWADSGLSLLRTLVSGAVFAVIVASLGFLGSRLPPRRHLSVAITIVSGSVVGLIWVGLVVFAVAGMRKMEGAWYHGVLIPTVMPVIVALLIAGRRDRFLSREAFIAALSGICGLGLVCAVALALMLSTALYSTLHPALLPIKIAGLVCAAGLFSILLYTVRTRSTAGSSFPPADSE